MRLSQVWIASAVLLAVCGCGGGSTAATTSTVPPILASGNWALVLFSQSNPPLPLTLGGSLIQQGNSVLGVLHAPTSSCFDPMLDDLVVSGSVDGQTVTFSTEPVRGQTITISTTVKSAGGISALSGTYTFSGSTCIGATGTASGFLIPPLTGIFAGPVTGSLTGNVTANLTQTGPDEHGFFHLSGNLTFSGSPCFTSGTIVSSSLSGIVADFSITTNDGGHTAVAGLNSLLGITPSFGISPTVETGTCAGLAGDGSLTKQ